jgi:signal transduction histidine kinase
MHEMTLRRVSPPTPRWLRGLLASVVMVAVTSALVVPLKPYFPPLYLYLLPVLAVAIVWGTGLAAVTSILSVTVYVFLFVPPVFTFGLTDLHNALALGVFLVAGVVVGDLAGRLRRAAQESERLSEEQSALRRVATLVARGVGPDLVFAAVAEEVGTLFGGDLTAIWRFEPDGESTFMAGHGMAQFESGARTNGNAYPVLASVRQTGRAARLDADDLKSTKVPEMIRGAGIRCAVYAPIAVGGHIWGAMVAASLSGPLPPDTEQRLADFTELVATAIANAEAHTEVTASRARIVAAADQTRRRIERDLHDGAQQSLVSAALQLRAAQAAVPPGADELGAELDDIASQLKEAVEGLREIARGIHPAILAEGGLSPALRILARRFPITVDLTACPEGRLSERLEVNTYYLVSEALTNAAKHAQASTITVAVAVEAADEVLRVSVRDNGVGGADFSRGTGLVGLKDRVEALGGRITLDSPRGAGTGVHVELPLSENGATPSGS